MDFKSIDWRSFKRYFTPQASSDLNHFLEKMPQNAGNAALIAAGISWMFAAALGLYTTVQVQTLTEMRHELKENTALKPMVPQIKNVPVRQDEVKKFAEDLKKIYPDLGIKQQSAAIYITASSTANFGQFREAIGHVQNGGSGWSVSLDKLCVGRECSKDNLAALLKINKVSVDKPQ